MIEPGQYVKIKKLSKESYLLYKQYKNESPLMVCPCHLEDKILKVSLVVDKKIALLNFNESITIVYTSDLAIVEIAHHQIP
jgi:hypothetical protein